MIEMTKCEKCECKPCRNGDDCWYHKNGKCHYCHCDEIEEEDELEFPEDFECQEDREPAECGAVLGQTQGDDNGNVSCAICSMHLYYDPDLDRWYGVDSDGPFETPWTQGPGWG